MKQIFFLLLFSSCVTAQRFDVKPISGTQYLIKQDTSSNGVITITKTPLMQMAKELESAVSSILGQIQTIDNNIIQEQATKKELNLQLKQLQDLQSKLGFR